MTINFHYGRGCEHDWYIPGYIGIHKWGNKFVDKKCPTDSLSIEIMILQFFVGISFTWSNKWAVS